MCARDYLRMCVCLRTCVRAHVYVCVCACVRSCACMCVCEPACVCVCVYAIRADAAQKTVAFHAFHSTDPFSVASHGTIVYDAVTTNVGNAYDKQAGIFTAPVAGTYVFFINCMSVDATSEESYILVDGASVAACYSSKPRTMTTEQGGTLTTVHLTAGQKVWVQILQNAENVRGYRWNTFSGFLVRADV